MNAERMATAIPMMYMENVTSPLPVAKNMLAKKA
jgi:hypothetical protein